MAKNNNLNLNNLNHFLLWLLLLLSALASGIHTSAKAESCLNGGYLDASAVCVCPPGFGGTQCALPQCGGNAFSSPRPLQNANASVLPGAGGGSIIARRGEVLDEVLSSESPLGVKMGAPKIPPASMSLSSRSLFDFSPNTKSNVGVLRDTNDTCACDDGWTGLGCGVCASPTSCNAAFLAAGGFYPSGGSISDGAAARSHNETLTCNTGPVVVNAGLMSCKVENASYTLATNPSLSIRSHLGVTLLRRPNGALSPVSGLRAPPAYAASAAPLALALWLDGVQQVSCAAQTCEVVDDRADDAGDDYQFDSAASEGSESGVNTTTSMGGGASNATMMKGKVRLSTRWDCSDLSCNCIPGTKYCGGTEEALNLTAQVSSISGDLTLTCPSSFNASDSSAVSISSTNNTSVTACALTSLSPAFRALFNVTRSQLNTSMSKDSIPPIPLTSCSFGECIAQNAFDASGFNPAASSASSFFSLSVSTTSLIVAFISGLLGAFSV